MVAFRLLSLPRKSFVPVFEPLIRELAAAMRQIRHSNLDA
jgi:hypothetical protein